jgi:hypothetical protein
MTRTIDDFACDAQTGSQTSHRPEINQTLRRGDRDIMYTIDDPMFALILRFVGHNQRIAFCNHAFKMKLSSYERGDRVT